MFGRTVPSACGFASMARDNHGGALSLPVSPGAGRFVARSRRPVCPSGPSTEPVAGFAGAPSQAPRSDARGAASGEHEVSQTLHPRPAPGPLLLLLRRSSTGNPRLCQTSFGLRELQTPAGVRHTWCALVRVDGSLRGSAPQKTSRGAGRAGRFPRRPSD